MALQNCKYIRSIIFLQASRKLGKYGHLTPILSTLLINDQEEQKQNLQTRKLFIRVVTVTESKTATSNTTVKKLKV